MPFCSNHPQVEAHWACPRCGKHWCDQCVQMVKGICKSFAFCPTCRDFCQDCAAGKAASTR